MLTMNINTSDKRDEEPTTQRPDYEKNSLNQGKSDNYNFSHTRASQSNFDCSTATKSLNSWMPRHHPEHCSSRSTLAVLKLAWTCVIAAYSDLVDVIFDVCVEDVRKSPSFGQLQAHIRPEQTVHEALESLIVQDVDVSHCKECGHWPNKNGPGSSAAYCLRSLLFVRSSAGGDADVKESIKPPWDLTVSRGILLTAQHRHDGVSLRMDFDPQALTSRTGQMMMDQLVHVGCRIQQYPNERMGNLLGVCPKGLEQIQIWNSRLHLHNEACCIHDMIARRCQEAQSSPAVHAWDGSLTYFELHKLSTNLAAKLIEVSAAPRRFIGIFLEKSMWTPVSILGIMKSGSAFVLLDPSLPNQRLQALCQMCQASLVLTSPELHPRANQLGPPVLVPKECENPPAKPLQPLPSVEPYQAAYIAFTSGSGGEPKGVMVDHAAVCSGVDSYCASVALDRTSRVFQFSSYSFTISVVDHLITLMQGACLCVPSMEQLRTDIPDTMRSFNVNWVTTTPSVARMLEPGSIPALKTLCLAGESLTRADLDKWLRKVDLKSIYGQSENTLAALVDTKTAASNTCDLGYPFAANCWIVHPLNHNRLVPIGAEGELLIEAPTLARGYLNNEQQTQCTFIYDPVWLRDVGLSGSTRFLKTGDIVRYSPDNGSIQYVGRYGTQIKLRGQRVELAEVEFHVKKQFHTASAVVADIVTPSEERSHEAALAVFIKMKNEWQSTECLDNESIFTYPTSEFVRHKQEAVSHLQKILPEYMVPTMFIPLTTVPLTPSGKLNRRLLRNKASGMWNELWKLHLSGKNYQQPCTEQEVTIRRICAKILHLTPQEVSMNSSFFELGGNSVTMMQLINQAREAGLTIAAKDIFQQLPLAGLAQSLRKAEEQLKEAGSNISSAVTSLNKGCLLSHIPTEIDIGNVSDFFPCTETQHWMLNNREGGYFLLRFTGSLDIGRLRTACQHLVKTHTALRSVFVRCGETLMQVVLKQVDPTFIVHTGNTNADPISIARKLCPLDGEYCSAIGSTPLRFTLVTSFPQDYALIIRLSHAQYDGICQETIVSDLCAFYQYPEEPGVVTDFAPYARQVARQQTAESIAFWRDILAGSTITTFPLTKPQKGAKEDLVRCSTELVVPTVPCGITMASVVKAAWSNVLRQMTGSNDIVFGQLVNTRGINMPRIYRTVGPCYNIIPVRVKYPHSCTVGDVLNTVQNQHMLSIPFETTEWSPIVSQCTDWPLGSRLRSLVIHQNFRKEVEVDMGDVNCRLEDYVPIEPPDMTLDLYSEPQGNVLKITLLSSSRFIAKCEMELILEKLCGTLTRFSDNMDQPLEF